MSRAREAFDQAVLGRAPFELSVRGLGWFPDAARPRVVWLGVEEGRAPLGELHAALSRTRPVLGIAPDRYGYRPHLTLGRVRRIAPRLHADAARALAERTWPESPRMIVDGVTLFSSSTGRNGPVYAAVARLGFDRGRIE